MAQPKNPLKLERSFIFYNNYKLDQPRNQVMLHAMQRMASKAKRIAAVPSSPYASGTVTKRLVGSIEGRLAGSKTPGYNVGVLRVIESQTRTPETSPYTSRGYALFQELGTGRYRGRGYIKPKTKKMMRWTQTIEYRFGRKDFLYAWRVKKGIGKPYRGKNIRSRFGGALLHNVAGRGAQRRGNLTEWWQIYAKQVKGVKGKKFLYQAFHDKDIRDDLAKGLAQYTKTALAKHVSKSAKG